ncbi:hypothetical protein MsAg5_01450 [Methanosarcinaceae archaeon Ag5]|uniref:Uncharacterized protein n=1 Tax=Methanolapillus africanus TaxID=3028297 RepID=A0AAE4MIA5_9EURY|nr:hypothetical protein [Methanosarcinaceae archaeon Ag5]
MKKIFLFLSGGARVMAIVFDDSSKSKGRFLFYFIFYLIFYLSSKPPRLNRRFASV